MFTGIVKGTGQIAEIIDHDGLRTFEIEFPGGFCKDLEIGGSVSIDGVCLTAVSQPAPERVCFDVMMQTLNVTTLGRYTRGQRVNIERAAKDGAEIGGHLLSGHVDFYATIEKVVVIDGNKVIRFAVPPEFSRYIFPKGYIAVNGTSLTISDASRKDHWFEVWLIPETRRVTTFEEKQAGDAVNIEIERTTQVMVDTIRDRVDELLAERLAKFDLPLAQSGVL